MYVRLQALICVMMAFFHFLAFQDRDDPLPPQELRGKGLDLKSLKIPRHGLADWDLMARLAGEDYSGSEVVPESITKVRIFGFRQYNNGKNIDIVVTDKLELEFLRKSIHPSLCRRSADSDFTVLKGSPGLGAYLGVIQVSTDKDNYIIGVCQTGFIWGEFHGSWLKTFSSWPLAKLVNQWLVDITGNKMKDDLFSVLSGENVLEKGKAKYQEYLKAKTQSTNPGG